MISFWYILKTSPWNLQISFDVSIKNEDIFIKSFLYPEVIQKHYTKWCFLFMTYQSWFQFSLNLLKVWYRNWKYLNLLFIVSCRSLILLCRTWSLSNRSLGIKHFSGLYIDLAINLSSPSTCGSLDPKMDKSFISPHLDSPLDMSPNFEATPTYSNIITDTWRVQLLIIPRGIERVKFLNLTICTVHRTNKIVKIRFRIWLVWSFERWTIFQTNRPCNLFKIYEWQKNIFIEN